MMHPDIRAALARERINTLLADAEAARTARQAGLNRGRLARPPDWLTGPAGPACAGTCSAVSWQSFGRIIDIPFEICVAALEGWQRMAQDSKLHIGQSLLHWPLEHDRNCGTCRIEVGLARGPLRPPRRMRLEINCWSPSPSRTALELIPCQRVRPTAAYFRSGHLLLDTLSRSLLQHLPAQHLDRVQAAPLPRHLPATRIFAKESAQQAVAVDGAAVLCGDEPGAVGTPRMALSNGAGSGLAPAF